MVSAPDLLSCDHRQLDFVESGRSIYEEHRVFVCQQCGKIIIHAWKDGVAFNLSFHINVERQVAMVGKFANWILEDDS